VRAKGRCGLSTQRLCAIWLKKMSENKAIFPDGQMNPQAAALYVGLSVKTLAKK
jgi:hypothetical protein